MLIDYLLFENKINQKIQNMANPDISDFDKGYVIFLIAGQECAINVKTLYTIINPLEGFSFRYSFNIGEESLIIDDIEIPFINLNELFNKKPPAQSKDRRIIIFHSEKHKAAFYVEKVKEFISLNMKSLSQSEFISISDRPFINGKLLFNDRSVLILDFDGILAET